MISCQPTPNGTLARNISERLNSLNPNKRVLVTEDGGIPISASLRKSDPFRKPQCRFLDPKCIVENGRDCSKQGVIYEISCKSCNENAIEPNSRRPGSCNTYNYIGITRTSVHWRMLNHLKGQNAKQNSNPLHRHDLDVHDG